MAWVTFSVHTTLAACSKNFSTDLRARTSGSISGETGMSPEAGGDCGTEGIWPEAASQKKNRAARKTAKRGSYRGRGASLAVASETISEHRGPLLVIHVGAAIPAEIAFHKIPGTNVPVDHGVNEIGIVIVRQTGIERLMTAQELKSERIGKVLRK